MNLEQPIPWRTRADLMSVEHAAPTTTTYTVKDPIKDEFYFFSQIEYFILKHLRSPQTFATLIQAAANDLGHRFAPSEIQNYLHHLAKDNLIVPSKMGDGSRLYRQRTFEQSGSWKQQLLGLLSIKLPGFHPGGILPPFKPVGVLLFNPISLTLFLAALFVTILFAAFSFSILAGLVPPFAQLLSPEHVTAVIIGFVIAKILHEFGHAIACQYTGHECTEMGMLLLVFLPCLYCDVSDMWTEKKKWKRMLVSLAGVMVELAIAMICFWIWFFTVPGSLHNFCYSMMLITSINTLFINGNPLMRYDGYYALSDLSGVRNLGQVSKTYFSNWVGKYFLRKQPTVQRIRLPRFLFAYATGALVYRWFIMAAIGFGIWTFFDFQQLRSFGNIVVSVIVVISIVPIIFGVRNSIAAIGQHGLRWFNTLFCAALVIGSLYLFLGMEFSHRIWGSAEIELANPQYVFAPSDGRFESSVSDGEIVTVGDKIGTIENPELDLEKLLLGSQLEETRLNLKFNNLAGDSHHLARRTEYWKKREETLLRQIIENDSKRGELDIHSETTGQVVALKHPKTPEKPDSLQPTSGSLLDEANRNFQIRRGEPICYIAHPDLMKAFLSVDQKDIEIVEIGQTVKFSIPFQQSAITGTIINIAIENEVDKGPTSPQVAGEMVTYRVEVEFESDSRIRVGSIQKAVIICHKTNTLNFIGRWLRNSFWF